MSALLRYIRAGYDRRSLLALAGLIGFYALVGYSYQNLIHPERGMDWLLAGIWTFMSLTLIWDIRPRRDGPLILVGLIGGAVIEWWGTNTLLWRYFTDERPPLWILPAWPIAALTVDRIARVLERAAPWLRRGAPLYWPVMIGFVALMLRFMWPAVQEPSSIVVVILMAGVTLWRARPGADLVLFIAGVGLGVFLEYWGTTRWCWIYYTEAQPPVEAVLAHGFASVAFARGVQVLRLLRGAR